MSDYCFGHCSKTDSSMGKKKSENGDLFTFDKSELKITSMLIRNLNFLD